MNPTEAASMLFQKHGDEVYRYIRYTVGGKTEADDILQEVFLRVLQYWGRFNYKSSPTTWLWAIAKNCIRDYFRKQKRNSRISPMIHDIPAGPQDQRALLIADLEHSLQFLSEPQQEVFVERIINDRSTSDTAKVLGWSEAKVRTTLHRAVKRVRSLLEDGGERHG